MNPRNDDPGRLIDDLSKDARVLKQARRLPMTALTDDHIAGVRRDYIGYTSKHGVFDAQIARETGISATTISEFRWGKYKGDNAEVARVLNDWMERNARQREAQLPKDYVPTGIAEDMQTIVKTACTTCSMVAIVAPSGSGKSMILEVLADQFRGRLLYCTSDDTPRAFLRKVAKATEAGRSYSTKAVLMEQIVEKLRGTNRPLFLDEAHTLPPDVLPRIRAIYDQARVPIVMAGTHEILARINDRTDGRGQFASRCLLYDAREHALNSENPSRSSLGRPLFTKDEIAQFLNGLRVRFQPDAMDLAWAIACLPNHGCLRTIHRVVALLRPNASGREKPITRKDIRVALLLVFGLQGASIVRSADCHIELAKQAG